jgi:type IX secretion system PorP/SprF family membrane protein
VPDANVGLYYNHPKYYIGFSITQLFESVAKFSFSNNDAYQGYQIQRHYYLTSGLRYEMPNDSYVFEPSFLVKASEALFLQADINAKIIYENNFWGGISFRTNKSIATLVGMKAGKLYFGYAFEYGIDAISSRHSYGSHEIMISIKMGDPARRYRWIKRY